MPPQHSANREHNVNYRLVTLIENAPEEFEFIPELTRADVHRPFALFAADLQSAENALAPFGSALTVVIVTIGVEIIWKQLTPFLIHIVIPPHQHSQETEKE